MKTLEEIEQLANEWSDDYEKGASRDIAKRSYIAAYTQCQEDMADYIFEVARQFHRLGKYSGTISDNHFVDIYEKTIELLNKQD